MLGAISFAPAANDPNAAPNPYHVDEGWAKLPQGRKWGVAIGVDDHHVLDAPDRDRLVFRPDHRVLHVVTEVGLTTSIVCPGEE